MNENVRTCPAADVLERFLDSALDEGQLEDVAVHLNSCTACRERIESAAGHGALAEDVRQAALERAKTPVDVSVPAARLNELLKDYEILGEIGRGGMGVVYKARQVKLNRVVALKVLPALLGAVRPDAAARLRREAELAGRLKHSNIIAVHDFGEIDGTLYYAMELIEGPSLRDVLAEIAESGAIDVVLEAGSDQLPAVSAQPSAGAKSEVGSRKSEAGTEVSAAAHSEIRNPKSAIEGSAIRNPKSAMTRLGSSSRGDRAYFRRVAGWIADVAEALDYAHEQGVIHRDVKPSNLLLASDGRLMISDFGLARGRGVETLTATRSLLGTARYMAPEQADEAPEAIDRRADVYGLGATLYELLAFQPMFAGADDREVLDCVLNKEPAPPHRLVRQAPRELETICLKAIEKERGRRYATAKDMADDLRRWLLDLPIQAKRPGRLVRAGKFVRRRKLPVALAALAALLLIAAGLLYGGYRSSHHEAAQAKLAGRQQTVRALTAEAKALSEDDRYAEALVKVEAGLRQEPTSVELHYLRADLLGCMGRTKEALEALEELVSEYPDCWEAHYKLAMVYSLPVDDYYPPDSVWRRFSREERLAKAAHYRQHVERIKPGTAEAYYVRACGEEDPHRATELLNLAEALEPSRVEVFMERARRYAALHQYDAMLLDAERAVTLRNGFAPAHILRGSAFRGLRQPKEAVEAYGRAVELEPKNAGWWMCQSCAKLEMGRFNEAVADASEAIRLDPEYAQGYNARSRARQRLGQLDEGLADINRAIELAPMDPAGYSQRASLHGQAGRWQDVVADSSRYIQLKPNAPIGYQNRAVAYHRLGQYDREIADLTRYVELKPDNDKGYRTRAVAFGQTKQFAEAIEDLTKAIELAPRVEDFDSRANCYLRLGRVEEAIHDLTRVIHWDSPEWSANALLKRGMAYELNEATKLALADYARATTFNGPLGQYAILWEYILRCDSGQVDAAHAAIATPDVRARLSVWTERLLDLFVGELTPDGLLAAAVTDDERSEAHYYVGRKALLEGDQDAARASFEQCLALNRDAVLETDFARALLWKLAPDAPALHAPVAATTNLSTP